eukprot:Platyproteum_vivax@DN5248_c1_g1_i1.p1
MIEWNRRRPIKATDWYLTPLQGRVLQTRENSHSGMHWIQVTVLIECEEVILVPNKIVHHKFPNYITVFELCEENPSEFRIVAVEEQPKELKLSIPVFNPTDR